MPHASQFDVSSAVTSLVLGLDVFYRAEQREFLENKLDAEGLVPVHWASESPQTIDSWAMGINELRRCLDAATTLPDPWARNWLTEYVLSLQTLVRWLSGEALSYEQVVAGALRVDPRPPPKQVFQSLQESLTRALKAGGYKTYQDYQDENAVSAAEVEAVMSQLLSEARLRTEQKLPMLRLPSEPMRVVTVTGMPFTAYCDYPGRAVWINTDVPHTTAGLKHLVGHEAYPGHYAHMGHRESLGHSREILPDAALVVTNTASSPLFEGIAECGLDFIGWREEPEDIIAWHHNRLQQLCSLEVAHALHTERMTPAEAAAFLQITCDADSAWIEGRLRFVTHRLRAPFIYAYWSGGTAVSAWWSTAQTRPEEAIPYLYDKMHSPSTLPAHWSHKGQL